MPDGAESRKETVVYLGSRKMVVMQGELQGANVRIHSFKTLFQPAGFEKGFVKSLGDATQTLVSQLPQSLDEKSNSQEVIAWIGMGQVRQRWFSFESSKYYGSESHPVSALDVRSVIAQTRSVATLPLDQQILQVRPETFLVDDIQGVRNPLGLEARRLGVKLKLFTMPYHDFKNIAKALEAADVGAEGFIPKSVALSFSVLSEEEKKEGVILVDLSSDHSLFVYWNEGQWVDMQEVSLGTDALTTALANALQLDFKDADKIKEKYASLSLSTDAAEGLIPMVERDGKTLHQIKKQDFLVLFGDCAATWMQTLNQKIRDFAKDVGCKHPRLVLTGGGAALEGLADALAKEIGGSVRLGYVHKIEAPQELLVDLSMTSAVASFRWLATHYQEDKLLARRSGTVGGLIDRVRDWFVSYF